MIELKNINKDWKEFKLKNINLKVNDGEYFIILGPSGAGKTLLLELIAGVEFPDSGEIIIDGRDVTYLPPEKRNISIVYQDYMLFPHKNVHENIAFGLEVRGENDIDKKVKKIAELLGIKHLLHRYPRTLSGGEKQRVALARALIIEPKILLLDEPLSALDERIRDELMVELKRMHERFNISVLHVTHNFKEALALADRIGIMKDGKILQVGTPEEIFRKPKNEFIANFVGVKNLIFGNAYKKGDLTIVDTGNIKITAAEKNSAKGKVCVTVRPEDITISKKKVGTSALNEFKGHVIDVIHSSPLVELIVDVGEIFHVYLTKKSFEDLEIKKGSEVWIQFKASAVHIIEKK
ncbi:tungstate/molybdate transport system ATP-binding protein [Methanothermus fervidus DSM 2088]|uniref:Molybdate/tungstate import ATP-binding protein WtpC n=1 Tax=Methanothermus fervidus (strain ATCC 43054 / DSM 2088 / JCM 10308 / V24 S) TaxID=523846 RepID=E3GW13_METFV|nr:tungstate ABC transporter ATP-binding protein WtpC [Methanothermus fervidus]ADP77778.1 tungstate/molybdate transport system ATP-binding protein [Methanothermus fervidus DSM 2088]